MSRKRKRQYKRDSQGRFREVNVINWDRIAEVTLATFFGLLAGCAVTAIQLGAVDSLVVSLLTHKWWHS